MDREARTATIKKAVKAMDIGLDVMIEELECGIPVSPEAIRTRSETTRAVAYAVAAAAEAHDELDSYDGVRERNRLYADAIEEVLRSGASVAECRLRLEEVARSLRDYEDYPEPWKREGSE